MDRKFRMDRADVDTKIRALIDPFNKKGVEHRRQTRPLPDDLEFDSLTVMDFVAAIEDEFDIIISMNQQAEIENLRPAWSMPFMKLQAILMSEGHFASRTSPKPGRNRGQGPVFQVRRYHRHSRRLAGELGRKILSTW